MLTDKKVLLVEDDFINMRLTQHVLETEGYNQSSISFIPGNLPSRRAEAAE